jgi:O-succinylbenzoate synthase
MHDAHVKCKESQMNRFIHDELYDIPDLHLRLDAAARRARAQAIQAGLASAAAALRRLARRLAPRFDFHPSHWMERLG